MTIKNCDIIIVAEPKYLPDQSSPENLRFLWSYDITITNKSDQIIQLLNRYWKITDMRGKVEEVRGPGVVGLQPMIKPEKNFSYSSFCQLTTAQGSMEGHYEIQTLDEVKHIIPIAQFFLKGPLVSHNISRSSLH